MSNSNANKREEREHTKRNFIQKVSGDGGKED